MKINILFRLIVFTLFAHFTFISCSGNNGSGDEEDNNQPGNQSLLEKYNIKNDGKTLTTSGIQEAINDCAKNGGGIVSLPAGEYLTGTIKLRSKVTLNLEKGAIIYGSRNISDYLETGRRIALIFAENLSDIGITGEGEIHGNGDAYNWGNGTEGRPTLVLLFDCKKVNVNGVKLSDSGFWTFRFVRCDVVDIRNVSVDGHATWNNDGFDIESKNVTISDCVIDADDDALCFKNEDTGFTVENVSVTNCKLASNCNFIKFGTASAGGFKNISVSNCQLSKCSKSLLRFWENQSIPGVTNPITGLAGIALEIVDGGFMENITISDITMEDVQTPIFIRLGKRKISSNSYLKDIHIKDITAKSESYVASSITGVPGLRIQNIEISNVNLNLKGGGRISDSSVFVPEKEDQYPENRMFDKLMLPGFGFYIRHADGIKLDNVSITTYTGTEERHTIFADDVTGLAISNSKLKSPDSNLSVVHLESCKSIKFQNNSLSNTTNLLYDLVNTSESEVESTN